MAKVWRTASATIGGRENGGDAEGYLDAHPRCPAVVTATVNEAGDMDRRHREAAAGYIARHPRTPAILTRGTH